MAAGGAAVAVPALLAPVANAIEVTTLADNSGAPPAGSLREAIETANATPATLDTITFQSGLTGTITLDGAALDITSPITVEGPGSGDLAVSGNDASRVFAIGAGGVPTLRDLEVTEGYDPNYGGGIVAYYDSGDITLERVVISDSYAADSGAGAFPGDGGGAHLFQADSLTLIDSEVRGNKAADIGGGILSAQPATTISGSLIFDNQSVSEYAGGLFTFVDTVITNTTISGNVSGQTGGGIYAFIDPTLDSVTITGNAAATVGGGLDATATINNSIIAGNAAPTEPDLSTPDSLSNSLIGDTTDTTIAPGNGNILDTPAELGPLASNGGPTSTHALLPTSPALDSGTTDLTVDQRGISRPQGTADDMGAFEFEVDEEPPALQFDSVPPASSTNPDAVAEFSSDATDLDFFEFSLDGSPPQQTTSPLEFEDLPVGAHVLDVTATDTTGNTSDPISTSFEVLEFTGTFDRSKKQKQGKKKVVVKVKAGGNALHIGTAKGNLKAKGKGKASSAAKKFKFKKVTRKNVVAGKSKKYKLKPKSKKDQKKILMQLGKGKKFNGTVKLKLVDEFGNRVKEKLKVKVQAK